jgi:hypothetical protein
MRSAEEEAHEVLVLADTILDMTEGQPMPHVMNTLVITVASIIEANYDEGQQAEIVARFTKMVTECVAVCREGGDHVLN